MQGTDIAAWFAAGVSATAILRSGYTVWKSRKTEKNEIEQALDRQPLVKESLALGNVGDAVKHLNLIIEAQTRAYHEQSERLKDQAERLEEQDTRIEELIKHNEFLQAENYDLKKEIGVCRDNHTELAQVVDQVMHELAVMKGEDAQDGKHE